MRMIGLRAAALVLLGCLAAGCGSSGVETGLPKDMTPGSNPTPDMGPSPNAPAPAADSAKK